ncbi:MAG: ABC transporter substrate-binding protein [Thermodesulfobacteriota bacterium]
MKRFRIIILALLVISFFIPGNKILASPVHDQLKGTIDNVLEILRDDSLKEDEKKEEKIESLRRILHERFSFAKMSQLSLARHWRKRSDEEKKVFIDMFGQLLEETYVSKIDTYTDEKVVYVKEFIRGKKAQINTKIITDTVEIPIDYRMYETKDGKWMVYDLVIEGVSLVGNYRSQFDQILQKESYEKLVENLKKKLDN